MRRILMAGIAGLFAVAIHAQAPAQGEWGGVLKAERHYCMSDVCLGMSLKEVSNITGTHLTLMPSNKWSRNCEGSFSDWDYASFIAKDGTEYQVGFRDFPGPEGRDDRFRVQSVSLSMPLDKQDFFGLAAKLANRYKLASQPGNGASDQQKWMGQRQGFFVSVNAMYFLKPTSSLMFLGTAPERYQAWLSTQPLCMKTKKPLPQI